MANKRAPQCCVVWNERHEECPLDVLMEFKEWTHKQHLKSYVDIAEMLHISANDANRLLSRAVLPDKAVCHRMKELMYEGENHI
ncbi:hypothetical protein [Streptococcus lutetiensis]|uniref:hypothetical protein n=1 Tax=Streptococcus lutetiensis TaxID=150055 RepID=UPI001BDAEFB8|nr:hypothetical protein [Streptococcus lutetiensis]MBT0944446.1 hypothetical protein [Streptococcus lutetiensis]MBT0949863.1 hypothetical protein [Streptococcus lutetiensis]